MAKKTTLTRTLKIRVRDKHIPLLRRWAFEVNQVWNAANELSAELSWVPVPEVGFMNFGTHKYDLEKDIRPMTKERGFDIHSHTWAEVISEHHTRRKQYKKNKLRWRVSSGSKRALGWVPFKSGNLKYKNGQVYFNGHYFGLWDSYGLSQYQMRSGSFSEDARGRWYLNITVRYEPQKAKNNRVIGVDLGLKDYATCSDGTRLEAHQFYRNEEERIASAQRAGNKKQVRNLHARVKNRRKDALHKFTTALAEENQTIVVGDVSSSKLAKTNMAKSVLDAGWYMLKVFLKYKAIARSGVFIETNEAYSTQTCSACGSIEGPRGRAGLEVRTWECSCGAVHERDVNAARNILIFGLGHQPQ